MKRCEWATSDPLYIEYHDKEWGVPIHDDGRIFEFLILEGMQAGLSWITILRKRDNFRKAFDNFDPEIVALYDGKKIKALLSDPGIIRNKLKVNAAVTNARAFLKVREEFGTFSRYIWGFTDHGVVVNHWKSMKELPAKTELSETISRDLKKRGFKFVGPTVVYAHMQAAGMVNDHVVDCFRHKELR